MADREREMPEVGEAIRRADQGATWDLPDPSSPAGAPGRPREVQDRKQPDPAPPPPMRPSHRPAGRGALAALLLVAVGFGVPAVLFAGTGSGSAPGEVMQEAEATETVRLVLPAVDTHLSADRDASTVQLRDDECRLVSDSSSPGSPVLQLDCGQREAGRSVSLSVPEGVSLDVSGGKGLDLQGSFNSVRLQRGGGGVEFDDVEAFELNVQAEGNIEGEVTVGESFEATSDSGDVDVRVRNARATTLRAPRGEVSVRLDEKDSVNLELTSTGGERVRSEVADDDRAEHTLTVEAHGDIRVRD